MALTASHTKSFQTHKNNCTSFRSVTSFIIFVATINVQFCSAIHLNNRYRKAKVKYNFVITLDCIYKGGEGGFNLYAESMISGYIPIARGSIGVGGTAR